MMMPVMSQLRRGLLSILIGVIVRQMEGNVVRRRMRRCGFGKVHAAKQHPDDYQQSHDRTRHGCSIINTRPVCRAAKASRRGRPELRPRIAKHADRRAQERQRDDAADDDVRSAGPERGAAGPPTPKPAPGMGRRRASARCIVPDAIAVEILPIPTPGPKADYRAGVSPAMAISTDSANVSAPRLIVGSGTGAK